MSLCRFEELDALLAGELSGPKAAELELHVRSCQSCAHELKWLETERSLFEQRAAHQRLASLRPRRQPRRLAGVAAGLLAASVLLAVAGGRVGRLGLSPGDERVGDLSVDPQLTIATVEQRFGACLVATPNWSRPCGPSVPASFP